jgi:acetyl-CoA acyltransferase
MRAAQDPKYDPVVVAAKRTAVGKAKRGSLQTTRPEKMAAEVIRSLLREVPALNPEDLDDVMLGCAFPEGEQGMNIARLVSLKAGLPVSVPAETINRFCSSGLQSIAHAAQGIASGAIDCAAAGGVESMSMVPMTGYKFSPDDSLADEYPQAFTSMGITAENVAVDYQIDRETQDQFSLQSHRKASAAINEGKFSDQIVPIEVNKMTPEGEEEFSFEVDEGPRPDTSLGALSKLRPAFKIGGTVTAGNSSQMSDGAAVVLIMSLQKASELGLKPLARFIAYTVAGVPPEIMGMGPTAAVPKLMARTKYELKDMDLIELNEAFASQSVAVIRELNLNEEILNVNGGAIALGHPLGCTGGKLTVQMIYELKRRQQELGLITMCIGGGMGAAAIIQNLD